MPSRGSTASSRRSFLVWVACVAISALLLATPDGVRDGIASALEWSIFVPVRAVLGWDGRSLLVQHQNRRLAREATSARLEIEQLREAGRENEVLRRMLAMRSRALLSLTPARVVGRNLDWTGEVLWLEVSGVAVPGTAVVTPDGLLGRVSRAGGARAQVETLWHSRLAVSVVDGRSREQGILRWDPAHPRDLTIDLAPLTADFRVGDAILTSGLGEVFPRGILVGYVIGAEPETRTQLKRIHVRPSARRGRMQEVFLVNEGPPEGDATPLFPAPEPTPAETPALPGEGEARP
jgi:rod shape-determining protein MreC